MGSDTLLLGLAIAIGVGLLALIGLCINAAFLLLGAKLASIEGRTFRRAFWITLLGGLAGALVSGIVQAMGGVHIGIVAGFLVTALVAMTMFKTTYGKAVVACLLSWILGPLVLGAAALVIAVVAGVSLASVMNSRLSGLPGRPVPTAIPIEFPSQPDAQDSTTSDEPPADAEHLADSAGARDTASPVETSSRIRPTQRTKAASQSKPQKKSALARR